MSILLLLSFVLLLVLLPIPATSFQTEHGGESSTSSTTTSAHNSNNNNHDDTTTSTSQQTVDLFEWAKQHGAIISSSIQVQQSTPYGSGRGIYATRDVPANTELITIPYHLQLGIRQLAMGNDIEMQAVAKSLPWEYIIKNDLGFIPLSVAVVAERRKGHDSIFHVFLNSLPRYCSNAVGTGTGGDIDANDDDAMNNLINWSPNIANKVRQKRLGISTIHKSIITPTTTTTSVSMEEFTWAASNVCSRSLVRKRIMELTSDETNKVGEFAASDHSRLLPVIDLVNHGSLDLANVVVGHFGNSRSSGANDDEDNDNDFSTSLISTRDIKQGEELLFDYGGGSGGGEGGGEGGEKKKKISNDRLLLDYGFVLPGHTDRVSITLEEFQVAISELEPSMMREGMSKVSEGDRKELDTLVTFLIRQLTTSELHEGIPPLLFFVAPGGEPTPQTLAIALVMTCRGHDDVTRVLTPAHGVKTQHDAALLPNEIIDSCTELQREFAKYTLKRAASLALIQRTPIITTEYDDNDDDTNNSCDELDNKGNFDNIAREYSIMCREMLKDVADMSK